MKHFTLIFCSTISSFNDRSRFIRTQSSLSLRFISDFLDWFYPLLSKIRRLIGVFDVQHCCRRVRKRAKQLSMSGDDSTKNQPPSARKVRTMVGGTLRYYLASCTVPRTHFCWLRDKPVWIWRKPVSVEPICHKLT